MGLCGLMSVGEFGLSNLLAADLNLLYFTGRRRKADSELF